MYCFLNDDFCFDYVINFDSYAEMVAYVETLGFEEGDLMTADGLTYKIGD